MVLQTSATFSGTAYPFGKVILLKDGQIAATAYAGQNASFQINLTGISSGSFLFSLYGEDADGRRSPLFTIPTYITHGATTSISEIALAPTIEIDKSQVKEGSDIQISGVAAPNSTVTISVRKDDELLYSTAAGGDGRYKYRLDTSVLKGGRHSVRTKATFAGGRSPYSTELFFEVAQSNVAQTEDGWLIGDFNRDGHVNIIDFSIADYWYGRPAWPEILDLSGDGRLDLTDFSILAFYWTG